ncbi:MAG: hypothetical protein IJX47_05270 [Clostridia bacterium]|nr:hypothetical protein [Clostridia bacterium]
MALWFSNSDTSLPMLPVGNGQLLLWEEGVTLYSLRMGYSAPHLLTMTPDFGGAYHEIDTQRIPTGGGFRHRLYYGDETIGMPTRTLCDLQITDLLSADRPIFLRRLDGINRLSFRLTLPSYVRKVYHPSYRFGKMRADTLFLTVPAGTAFDSGMATLRERTAAVVFCGTLRYDPSDGTVYYGGDLGEMYVLACDDPKEMIRVGDELLQAFCNFAELPFLHPFYGRAFQEASDHAQSSATDAAGDLLAMQSASGAVVASHREPFAASADLPSLTALFLQSGRREAALRMLLYWTEQAERIGFVPALLSCDADAVCPQGQPDAASTASYLLAAARFCRKASPSGREADLLYRGMRSAFSSLMQSFRDGMLPFGTRTQAFDAGLLGRDLLFQGSAEVTAPAIRAGREFTEYCRESGRRTAKEERGYSLILSEAADSFESNFTVKGKLCRNAPKLETRTRRPRFIRGTCTLCQRDGAYPAEDMLELDKYGRYLCRRCFVTRRGEPEETDPAKRYSSFRATAQAALTIDSGAALSELGSIAATYLRRLRDPKAALPLRESDTDPLLLLALRTRRDAMVKLLTEDAPAFEALRRDADLPSETSPEAAFAALSDAVQKILLGEREDGTLPALLCDTVPLGARCAAGATALAALALT